ncbi:MAG TPA: hypothetical protein VFK88_09390 [Gallionella sp.]|nr:hypothetical protein [Gallionella sp.]
MRYLYPLTAIAIAILVAGIMIFRPGQSYYPVLRADLPDGVSLTFIEQPWADEQKCLAENKKIVTEISGKCPACRIVRSSCSLQPEPEWNQSLRGVPINIPVVHTGSQNILIGASVAEALAICTGMAEQITRQGKQRARCIPPLAPR